MAAAARSRGRPPGAADATLAKAREVLAAHETNCASMTATASVELLAVEEKVSTGTIWNWVSPARVAAPARVRPRMSQRAVLYRAWIAMRTINVFRALGGSMPLFWLGTVLEIHELGEGEGLSFGSPGNAYRSREEFARAAGHTETELDDLIDRGLLLGLEGGGIDLPYRFGLRAREPIGGDALPGRPPKLQPRTDPRQTHLPPMGLSSTRDSGFNRGDSSENTLPDSSEIRGMTQAKIPVDSGENPASPARLKSTTTTKELDSSLSGGGDLEAASALEPNDSKENDSRLNTALPHIPLAAELVVLAGRGSQAAPRELNEVKDWLTRGAPPEMVKDVVRSRMARPNAPDFPSLSYFRDAVLERLVEPAKVVIPKPPPLPEPPEEPIVWDTLPAEPEALAGAWATIRATLQRQVGDADYRSWLRPAVLRGVVDNVIVLALPSAFIRDWVRDKYGEPIAALWREHYPAAASVEFNVNPGRAVA